MEALTRKPFQGIGNIIRFNWHFYVLAIAFFICLQVARDLLPAVFKPYIGVAGLLLLITLFLSLLISFYVYDLSGLYSFNWLRLPVQPGSSLINIHAGFDETSALLANKYPRAKLSVYDFYDPVKHTEMSIKRARKAYAPYPQTKIIDTANVLLQPVSIDYLFCILSAHEIRQHDEQVHFFNQLQKALKAEGKIIVVEHLMDFPNFCAYNIGFFHFHSGKRWRKTFDEAGLFIENEFKITPFLTAFIVKKNGTPP